MGAIENFLLPVIGGYLLLTNSTLTKHTAARLDNYNLIFRSLVFGLLLWAATYLFMWSVTRLATGTDLLRIINDIESELPTFIELPQLLCIPVGFGLPRLHNAFLNDDNIRHKTAFRNRPGGLWGGGSADRNQAATGMTTDQDPSAIRHTSDRGPEPASRCDWETCPAAGLDEPHPAPIPRSRHETRCEPIAVRYPQYGR